ncbi:hypothetical protein FA15DRAFT_652472 [Coprinopsis marcescibilis]|uniref:Uncharacterized protein n=1 Tax=Coprinopsis marcescibilis TaxID=230819 RepID=A0A5C3L6S6_COPMA|nr:hypothetical protein FA15DRAFT_652472 [Coprinopsis marcescibilis]
MAAITPGDSLQPMDARSIRHLLEGAQEPLEFPPLEKIPQTDYATFVTDALSISSAESSKKKSPGIDQEKLRECLYLASSFLITDTTMDQNASGLNTWTDGLSQLVQLVVVLHRRNELEAATVSAVSKACRECWAVAGSFQGLEDCRRKVREFGTRIKGILDEGGITYKGISFIPVICHSNC